MYIYLFNIFINKIILIQVKFILFSKTHKIIYLILFYEIVISYIFYNFFFLNFKKLTILINSKYTIELV